MLDWYSYISDQLNSIMHKQLNDHLTILYHHLAFIQLKPLGRNKDSIYMTENNAYILFGG